MELELENILNSKICVEKENPCVYFLIKNNEIIYIGQTIRIKQRIYEHLKEKDFDNYFCLYVSQDELLKKERFYIEKFTPKLNCKSFYYKKFFFPKRDLYKNFPELTNEIYKKLLDYENIPYDKYLKSLQVKKEYKEKVFKITEEYKNGKIIITKEV